MEDEDLTLDSEEYPEKEIKFYLDEFQFNFLQQLKDSIIEERAYQVLEWEATNLAVVAAADAFSRGKLHLIDLIINSAFRIPK
jgi:hypothetical protein